MKKGWPVEGERSAIEIAEGNTLQEVFLRSCEQRGSQIACADAITGVLSYRRLKLAALLISLKIRDIPDTHVGILLPATVGGYLVILAVLLAGKVPVMMNWTAGVRALDHAVDATGVRRVITSSKFLDRLENGELGKIEEMILFLEDLKKTLKWKDKLRAAFLGMKKVGALLKALKLEGLSPKDIAVILFTSGTEALPKGVPLSHDNLLSNQRAGISCVAVSPTDIFYGTLPPFHSFGFSATGLLPLFAGIKVCYAPDPTDSHGLAHDIAAWKPTLYCSAPSFIRGVFRVAKVDELQSLRYVVSGAERTPEELFSFVKQHIPHGKMLEGYGITECSPIVTIDRPDEKHIGVGRPVPGVELKIIDPETREILPQGKEGEVVIHGPNVFGGYLGITKDPFITLEGKQWYLSGRPRGLRSQWSLGIIGQVKAVY